MIKIQVQLTQNKIHKPEALKKYLEDRRTDAQKQKRSVTALPGSFWQTYELRASQLSGFQFLSPSTLVSMMEHCVSLSEILINMFV